MLNEPGFEFSFSGVKNAIRLCHAELVSTSVSRQIPKQVRDDLCASIEQAIVDVLTAKSLAAVTKYRPKTFILAGGVAANKKLRAALAASLPKTTRLLIPRPEYCMDNAAMIAAAAYYHIKNKNFSRYDKLKADANWELV
jgi:N6-L-threonylcarbamoyladenine synthase